MKHKNKRGFNLSLLIITVLIISSLCYLGVVFTSSVEIAKVEKNNYLKVEEDTLDEKTNRTSTNSNTSKVEETEDTTQAESSNANLSMLVIRLSCSTNLSIPVQKNITVATLPRTIASCAPYTPQAGGLPPHPQSLLPPGIAKSPSTWQRPK